MINLIRPYKLRIKFDRVTAASFENQRPYQNHSGVEKFKFKSKNVPLKNVNNVSICHCSENYIDSKIKFLFLI